MKIVTDETVARSTVALLRSLGHDVLDVKEAGLSGSDDSQVAALSVSERRIIVTHDKGFADFLRLRSVIHSGAIVLRLRDTSPPGTNSALLLYLSNVTDDYTKDKIVILTERGFRARKIGDAGETGRRET